MTSQIPNQWIEHGKKRNHLCTNNSDNNDSMSLFYTIYFMKFASR